MKFQQSYNVRSCYCTIEEAHTYIKNTIKATASGCLRDANGNVSQMLYQRNGKLIARIVYRNPKDATAGATLMVYK